MAQIKITGVDGTLSVSNDRAVALAADKKNIPLLRQRDMWIEIGSWQGYLSSVKSILIEPEEKRPSEDYDRPLTPEEEKNRAQTMKRIRENLEQKGIVKPKTTNHI